MNLSDVRFSFVGMEHSDALVQRVNEKLAKHVVMLDAALGIDVTFRNNISSRGVAQDFRLDINMNLPKSKIRIEEYGADLYNMSDSAEQKLLKRFNRYNDRKHNWEGRTPWKVLEMDQLTEAYDDVEDENMNYTDYAPKIAVRKTIENEQPMEDGEAIEFMELSGFNQLLFKNKHGSYSMVYRRQNGTYGLVSGTPSPLQV